MYVADADGSLQINVHGHDRKLDAHAEERLQEQADARIGELRCDRLGRDVQLCPQGPPSTRPRMDRDRQAREQCRQVPFDVQRCCTHGRSRRLGRRDVQPRPATCTDATWTAFVKASPTTSAAMPATTSRPERHRFQPHVRSAALRSMTSRRWSRRIRTLCTSRRSYVFDPAHATDTTEHAFASPRRYRRLRWDESTRTMGRVSATTATPLVSPKPLTMPAQACRSPDLSRPLLGAPPRASVRST